MKTASKLILTLAVLVVAGMGLVGMGASATFNDSKTVSQSVGSGVVTLTLGTTNTSANRLQVSATAIAPTDTIQRAVDIINGGTLDWGSLTLATSATTSSVLNTDTTNGLQMVIDECPSSWTEAGTTPNFTYTCSGAITPRVTTTPIIGTGISIGGGALTAGTTGHYRVTLTLPSTADNSFMSKTSVISYVFTGTQRAATAK